MAFTLKSAQRKLALVPVLLAVSAFTPTGGVSPTDEPNPGEFGMVQVAQAASPYDGVWRGTWAAKAVNTRAELQGTCQNSQGKMTDNVTMRVTGGDATYSNYKGTVSGNTLRLIRDNNADIYDGNFIGNKFHAGRRNRNCEGTLDLTKQ